MRLDTGESKVFNSINEASLALNLSRETIKNYMYNQTILSQRGVRFQFIDGGLANKVQNDLCKALF